MKRSYSFSTTRMLNSLEFVKWDLSFNYMKYYSNNFSRSHVTDIYAITLILLEINVFMMCSNSTKRSHLWDAKSKLNKCQIEHVLISIWTQDEVDSTINGVDSSLH